jgi:hypothetical protein
MRRLERRSRSGLRSWTWSLLLACCGCSAENGETALRTPSTRDFAPVSAVFERRCGGLDCHGSPARNLRIYGFSGLRANGLDVTGGNPTTEAEIAATFEAVVTIDPESLSRVAAERGASPERWLVVSKGRAHEHHEGGARLTPGTPGDDCIVSWLAGKVAVETCAEDAFGPAPRPGEDW